MTQRRFGGVAGKSAPSKRTAPVKREPALSVSWPPANFSVHATLVQPGCVKCRIACTKVRRFRRKGKYCWPEQCATVCDECWAVILAELDNHKGSLERSFWSAKPVKRPRDDRLVNLVDFAPHRATAGLWRQFMDDRRRALRKRTTN